MSLYIPVRSEHLDEKAAKNAARSAFRSALRKTMATKVGEETLTRFKANGMNSGHKLIDDVDCIRLLIRQAPDVLKEDLETTKLTDFEKSQQINAVLRTYWQLDKNGKIAKDENGEMVARKAKAIEKK